VIRLSVSDISILGRITSGVKLININSESDITVASVAKVKESEANTDEEIIKNLEKELDEEDDGGVGEADEYEDDEDYLEDEEDPEDDDLTDESSEDAENDSEE